MTGNFILNNLLTYRDRRLSGRRFVTGLLSFYAVCSLGAAANVGVAAAVFASNYTWWVSGLAGVLVGVVWNYAVSSLITWGRKSSRSGQEIVSGSPIRPRAAAGYC